MHADLVFFSSSYTFFNLSVSFSDIRLINVLYRISNVKKLLKVVVVALDEGFRRSVFSKKTLVCRSIWNYWYRRTRSIQNLQKITTHFDLLSALRDFSETFTKSDVELFLNISSVIFWVSIEFEMHYFSVCFIISLISQFLRLFLVMLGALPWFCWSFCSLWFWILSFYFYSNRIISGIIKIKEVDSQYSMKINNFNRKLPLVT